MSRSQRAGEGPGPSGVPPASSSRYHRSSIRSQKGPGLGSSSTRVQVVAERGYDSEIPRELGGMASVSAGYHTEGQASTTTKRASKELLRNVVDPRRNGRLSSMPSQHPTHSYNYDYPIHHLDDTDQSSTRRVRKNNGEKSRHRDREQRDPVDPVPPSVWINQLNAADAKRARRTSGSRTRHEEPQQFQHDPRAYPPGSFPPNQDHHRHPHYQSPPYGYAHHQSNPHRNGNPAPTHIYRPDDPAPDLPGAPQATNPRYDFVIDDRAGMHSPPPVEIPHPMQSPPPVPLTTPAAPLLPLPRSKEELLRSEGLPPQGSPLTGHRRHRPGRSEDFANGAFADATNHARTSLRHRPSHSEDLRKLGQGLPVAEPEEHITHQLARPFHVGRSASENVVPQIPATQPQLATPGMYSTGLAVTPAATRGFAMTPQLQESFAESANASRAPVNAAMASAAIANGTDSDSTRGEKERKRRTRRSRQVDAPTEGVSAADLQALQLAKEPTPPPTVQPIRRQRTVSGRSITAQPTPPPPPAIPAEMDREEDMVVYQRPPDPATVDSARAPQPITSPPVQARVDMFRMPGEPLPQGLAMFASRPEMTSSGITPAGTRTDMTQVPGPRADMTHEISRGVETLRAAGEVAPVPVPLPAARRGSILDEERTRKYSAATEGGASASGTGSRRPSGANEGQGRPVVRPEDQPHRRPSPNYAIATATRKSVASDASGDSFQSAQLGGSTTLDFQSARDAMSMAMSPMSNYHSIAPSVRSEVRDPRVMVAANEARNQDSIVQPGSKMTTAPTTAGYRPVEKRASGIVPIGHVPAPGVAFPGAHANPISPPPALANVISPSISKERVLRAAPVPATPMTVPKSVEPEVPTRPRVPSNDMLGSTPPDVPVLRATVDAHVPAPSVPVDEEGRLRGPPPVVSTMPNRPARMSLTRPPPQQTATPATSPPQTHAQTQPEASAVPKNLQQTQQVEGSKESLPETLASTKQSKSKSSKWWKSSSSAPKAPSPTPTPAPPGTSQPRQRLFSGFLPGSSKHKAQKPSESTPAPPSQPRPSGDEMYNFYESTPSSTTLEHEPEPREKESRMQRMVTAIRGGLRRTPSTSKIGGHFPSKSMSRLPGTTSSGMAGAPLARSASTNANGRDGAMFPMSPSRSKEPPLRPVAPPVAAPPAVPEPPVVPPSLPAPVPNSAPTPAPAPAMTVPISVVASSAAVPPTPKPRPAEAAPEKRPVKEKDVPIIDKTRVPISSGPSAPSTAPRVTRTYIDANGRPVDPTSRAEKRSSTQAPPPAHPQRPNSPPLVNRPVAPGRVPAGPNKIFTNEPPRTAAYPASGPAPVPNTPHTSHRTLSRSGPRITSQRDRVPSNPAAPSNQLRPSRSREQPIYPADPPPPPANATPGNADLGLPTPDATPRASPTGEDIFEGRADALREERERERERRQSDGRRHRPGRIVIPPSEYANYPVPSMDDVNQRLQAGADPNSHGGLLKFGHREKRAVSVASMEAVSGQEGHFRSETSSIRTSTPGPHQITFPNRDPAEATQSWAKHQTEEDIRAGTGRKSGRESRKRSGVLKHSSRTGVRKPGVAFDFPSGPIIEADEDPQESRQQADIHLTYELERRHKRYK